MSRAVPGVGLGVDVHRFGGPGPLHLGGVSVPFELGLQGHSDGDVLCHAVADAILGASNLGDMGRHFPSADEQWRGAASLEFLRLVAEMIAGARLEIAGIDATVIAEAPRLGDRIDTMAEAMAEALGIDPTLLSVKVKSSDGLGLTGRGEGIAALAVARVEPRTSQAPPIPLGTE